MFDQIRILFIIVLCGVVGFFIIKKVYKNQLSVTVFNHWLVTWIGIITVACLAGNYWLFAICVGLIGIYSVNYLKEDAIFLYLFLLPALPMLGNDLPGFAGIRIIMEFTYPRLLSLSILLPLFIRYKYKILPFNQGRVNRYFIWMMVYFFVIGSVRTDSGTDLLRSLVYIFLDSILPYFMVSRLVDSFERLNKAFIAIASSAIILSIVNIIEYFKYWFVYQEIYQSLNISSHSFSAYAMIRDGMVRSASVFSSPIVLGFFILVAFGASLGGREKKGFIGKVVLVLLLLALITSLSRGPWVGFMFLIFTIAWYSAKRGANFLKGLFFGGVGGIVLLLSPVGNKIINLLPFVGSVDSGNVGYRADLFSSSLEVIGNNLLFGTQNFLAAPELQHLMQGQGIIDIVNTYLQIALEFGLVGLLLFLAFFLSHLRGLYLLLRNKKYLNNIEDRRAAAALLGIGISIMVTIATVSKINYIPIYYLITLSLMAGVISFTRKPKT